MLLQVQWRPGREVKHLASKFRTEIVADDVFYAHLPSWSFKAFTFSRDASNQEKQVDGHVKPVLSLESGGAIYSTPSVDYGQPIGYIPIPQGDPYLGGILAAYAPHAVILPQSTGMLPSLRVPLPLEPAEDEPIYVNAVPARVPTSSRNEESERIGRAVPQRQRAAGARAAAAAAAEVSSYFHCQQEVLLGLDQAAARRRFGFPHRRQHFRFFCSSSRLFLAPSASQHLKPRGSSVVSRISLLFSIGSLVSVVVSAGQFILGFYTVLLKCIIC
uniref:Uncharacterized protein n=1 Tax=Ananas comosus var. bracteatus TaxID=296719 RepID=A0A6V7P2N7_ANACO|nr:unnamed protein product [Ananas comosus var. bracteatus]